MSDSISPARKGREQIRHDVHSPQFATSCPHGRRPVRVRRAKTSALQLQDLPMAVQAAASAALGFIWAAGYSGSRSI